MNRPIFFSLRNLHTLLFVFLLLGTLSTCSVQSEDTPTATTIAPFNGTYLGGCESESNGIFTNGIPQSNSYSDTVVVFSDGNSTIPDTIWVNGGAIAWMSGSNPASETIIYRNSGDYTTQYSFRINGSRLTSSWGASSPGGYSQQTCQYTRQ